MHTIVKPLWIPCCLCRKPYPLHPRGCPNYGKKASCPPRRPMLEDILDMTKPVWAIWGTFDFGGHVARMTEAHPEWSQRQAECCLYWQGGARKRLREVHVPKFQTEEDLFCQLEIVYIPEAAGVNVTVTMEGIGEHLEWPPVTVTYQIALAGARKEVTDENH